MTAFIESHPEKARLNPYGNRIRTLRVVRASLYTVWGLLFGHLRAAQPQVAEGEAVAEEDRMVGGGADGLLIARVQIGQLGRIRLRMGAVGAGMVRVGLGQRLRQDGRNSEASARQQRGNKDQKAQERVRFVNTENVSY